MFSINKIIIFLCSILLLFSNKKIRNDFSSNIPLISIIIPVHNNINYTSNCITSILNAETSISYEIIISNDISTDEIKFVVKKYFKHYSNIFIHNNHENLNYFSNFNNAVKRSKGKYLFG